MSFQRKESDGGGLKKDFRATNGNNTGFRTDTAISGNRSQGFRELQRWQPEEDNSAAFEGLQSTSSKSGAAWDQFAANERLFGLKTDYDETIYTTAIDRNAPDYAAKKALAEKKAREIEGSVATNSHIREERVADNLTVDDSGHDEEDKYSGVLAEFPPLASSGNSNKYVAPAKRAPTGRATVKGAPYDPAIIASQLARPKPVADQSAPKVSITPSATDSDTVQITTPPTRSNEVFSATPNVRSVEAASNVALGSRTMSPQSRPAGNPGAAATVARDLADAFKSFATQQRDMVSNKVNSKAGAKAKADKESKLSELKKFSETFKLSSALPADLVPILAKDPSKQREIQEKSQRQAEAQESLKIVKPKTTDQASLDTQTVKANQTTVAVPQVQLSTASGRQNGGRVVPSLPLQPLQGTDVNTPTTANRRDRSAQSQVVSPQQGRAQPASLQPSSCN